MGLLCYKPKHMKPDPTTERIKNVPNWIWGECVEYGKWYIQLFYNIIHMLVVFGEKIVNSGINLIDKIDEFEHQYPIKEFLLKIFSEIQYIFEKFKKFCYNIYRKLKKN